ncbi:hypothetical protein PIB30_068440 [Stylosanthes scabra]|uniref:Uncharacterized protein n=1 Tax=Stylosanthes scabra TaxID=79078 RepID=A0ABU6ZLN7_9FABA|nr:hypothetical protein [Stylosanthes scabra]
MSLREMVEKEQKEAWKARKEENRATGQKQSYSVKYRELTPRRHYPCLGVAEPQGLFALIQHPTPKREARRLGVDEVVRKWSCTKTSTSRHAPKMPRRDYVKLECNQASQHPRLSTQYNA